MNEPPFCDKLPDDRLYDPQRNMWVKPINDGLLEIGATAYGLHLAGKVIAFTPKPVGAEIDLGRGLGTMETGKTVLAVHCPLSLRLTQANEAAEENPSLLEKSPYAEGWMIRGPARQWDAEHTQLVDARQYRKYCLASEPDAQIDCI